jgi:hypothetical protein
MFKIISIKNFVTVQLSAREDAVGEADVILNKNT